MRNHLPLMLSAIAEPVVCGDGDDDNGGGGGGGGDDGGDGDGD